jgi:WhiB family redox-sensing transcriptional regulator
MLTSLGWTLAYKERKGAVGAMTVSINWRDGVACRDADPEVFFPIGTTGPAVGQTEEAKRICRVCQVRIQCLAWALDNGVTDGVWGGTTPDERQVIRSQMPRETSAARAHGG